MTWPREGSRETNEGIIISECLDWCICEGGTIAGYRLTAKQREATNMADSVRQTDDRTHVKDSIILRCEGDGKAKRGVNSGTIEGACWPKTWSESVTAEGRNVVRHDDEWWMNNRNTWGRLYYVNDTSENPISNQTKIDPKMFALYQAPNTATDAPPIGSSPEVGSPSGSGAAMSRLGTTLGIASLGYGVGQMAGQYYLGQEGNVAVGITNYQMGQVSPFSPQGQAIGGALGFPNSMSRIDEANNFLSLKAGAPVDFRTMSPDQLDQLVRQPWPSPQQITKNGEALKTKTKEKEKPKPFPPPPPGFRNSGKCRTETIPFDSSSFPNKAEYQRQLDFQQNALNSKGACKSYSDKDQYDQKSPAQKLADRAAAKKLQRAYTINWQATHPGSSTTGLAALHRLDMVAGGDMRDIADMGDSGINSSIGPEWTAETRGGKMKNYAKEMCEKGCPMSIVLKAQ